MNALKIAQLAVNLTVGAMARKFVRETAKQTTNAPDIVVEVGSGIAGAVAADKSKPVTDAYVEKTFIWIEKKFNTTP